jgi:hypothetical protein
MSCRIDRFVTEDDRLILIVSGRITAEDLDILRDLLAKERRAVAAIDLENVFLIDRDAVKLVVVAEANGVELRNCPPYVREWWVAALTALTHTLCLFARTPDGATPGRRCRANLP